MSCFIMNGKTFLGTFIDEDPTKVIETQFVIVSQFIRKSGRYEDSVINGNAILYPADNMLVDYTNFKSKAYAADYMNQLKETALPMLAVLIKAAIEEDTTIVFISSKKEWKYRYLKILSKFVEKEFGYKFYDYKKVIEGKEKVHEYDKKAVLKICDKILKDAKEEKEARALSSKDGRRKFLKELSKSELKKRMKKAGLDSTGMSRSEMIETLEVFL